MKNALLILKLALADLWYDRKLSGCMIIALVAVITPLLLLFGLKHGVIANLQGNLLKNPVNLEIRMLGNRSYDDSWIDQVRGQPQTGFVIGQTRSLSAVVSLRHDNGRFLENVEMIATAAGDPLVSGLELPDEHAIFLSARAAGSLNVQSGDRLVMIVRRTASDGPRSTTFPVIVAGQLSEENFGRHAILVRMPLQLGIERFIDGTVDSIDDGITLNTPAVYARARIYARDIDSVQPLDSWLNAQGIQTSSRLNEIDQVRVINSLLTLLVGVIASTGIIGCLVSLTGTFITNLDRKRRDMALLRLLGFNNLSVSAYVMTQAWLLTSAAFFTGLLAWFAIATVLNAELQKNTSTAGFTSQLATEHLLIALLITWTVATLASVWGALSAIAIQPAESLREV